MNKYTFSTQSGKAYYCNSIPGFIKDSSASVVGQLVRHTVKFHAFDITTEQEEAWENQINELQIRLEKHGIEGDIIFEYDIVRLGKRIDVILLIRHMVFSLEFKNGQKVFTAHDAQQAEDYAIDIKNFHKESADLYVCPILVATNASPYNKVQTLDCYPDKQVYLQRENIETLIPKISEISKLYGDDREIDFEKWFNSPYYPTPTIIAAAVEAYSSHHLSEIAQSEAGQKNINACEAKLKDVIEYAEKNKKKCVCFVTGVPGAGKTLVGLDVVARNLDKDDRNLSVYLSGNGPLVEVLREALKKSVKQTNRIRNIRPSSHEMSKINESINHLIESSYNFKKQYATGHTPLYDKIIIFDEAQRVWDQRKWQANITRIPR